MDSPPSAPWTYAARAGYFGDRVCPFCDHRNPAGARFCNDCGSPLDMKPCNQCDAVNHQAATNCYKCGAQCPALFTPPEATPVLPAVDPTPAWATPSDVGVVATVTQPPFAAGALRANWRLAAIATMLIAGVYAAYRINAVTPDAMGVASQPIDAGEHNAPTAAAAVPMTVGSKPVEPETTVALQAPIPGTNPEAPERANARQRPMPVTATKRASTRQRPMPELQARVGKSPPVAQQTREAPRPDPWQAMHVSLAGCGGDLIARIVCDQRVRRRFCEGHWGEAPECGSGFANDRGQ
jgi:ribosomal protein L40E